MTRSSPTTAAAVQAAPDQAGWVCCPDCGWLLYRKRLDRNLHVCPECEHHLVYPVEWEEHDATRWEVLLRCPNCEWHGTGTFEQDVVERFDEELDRGTEALVRDLKRLMQANMEDEIERFINALEGDHVLPEDF